VTTTRRAKGKAEFDEFPGKVFCVSLRAERAELLSLIFFDPLRDISKTLLAEKRRASRCKIVLKFLYPSYQGRGSRHLGTAKEAVRGTQVLKCQRTSESRDAGLTDNALEFMLQKKKSDLHRGFTHKK